MTSTGSPTPGSPAANRLPPPLAAVAATDLDDPGCRGRGRRRSPRRRVAGVLAGSLLAASVVAGLGSAAHAEPEKHQRPLKADRVWLCDSTGCLYAWRVVDSDGDGVSDADELVAGTDPYRDESTPPLKDLVDISARRGLPSFEAGLAAFVVFPPDLVAQREKIEGDRLGAFDLEGFPVPARADTLKRLGIDEGQMKEMGVDLGRTGFTLGLDANRKDDSGLPSRKVGGLDMSHISNDDGKDHTPTTPATTPAPTTPPASSPPATTAPDGGTGTDAGTGTGTAGGAGSGDDELAPLTKIDPHGIQSARTYDGVVVITYNNGDRFGWGPDYTFLWEADEPTPTIWPDYTNPDADEPTEVTAEQFEAWERTIGETTRTVEGWRTPIADGQPLPKSTYALIAYIEADLASSIVMLDEPRITTAQPEGVRDDLPLPGLPAPVGGFGGGKGGCSDGFCGG